MCDCVYPTRTARFGTALTWGPETKPHAGKGLGDSGACILRLKSAVNASDLREYPILLRNYSRLALKGHAFASQQVQWILRVTVLSAKRIRGHTCISSFAHDLKLPQRC